MKFTVVSLLLAAAAPLAMGSCIESTTACVRVFEIPVPPPFMFFSFFSSFDAFVALSLHKCRAGETYDWVQGTPGNFSRNK